MKVAQEGKQGVPSSFLLDFWNAENANYQNLVFSGCERSGQYTDPLQQITLAVRFNMIQPKELMLIIIKLRTD